MEQQTPKQAPAPQPHTAPAHTPATPTNGLAVAALVLGIISLLSGLFFVGGLFGIAAIIFGALGLKKPGGRGMSIAGIVMGILGTLGSIIMFILLIVGISIFGTAVKEASNNPPSYSNSQQAGSQENDINVTVGQSATVDGQKMTVTNIEKVTSFSEFDTAEAGKEFVVATVEIENTSNQTEPYNVFDFSLQTAGGQILDSYIFGPEPQLNSGDLIPGGKVSGKVTFEAPIETGEQFIIWKPNFFDSARAVVKL